MRVRKKERRSKNDYCEKKKERKKERKKEKFTTRMKERTIEN